MEVHESFNDILTLYVLVSCIFLHHFRHSFLIDDREALREKWERAGGIFIHHVDTETTLQRLREHGVYIEEDEYDTVGI